MNNDTAIPTAHKINPHNIKNRPNEDLKRVREYAKHEMVIGFKKGILTTTNYKLSFHKDNIILTPADPDPNNKAMRVVRHYPGTIERISLPRNQVKADTLYHIIRRQDGSVLLAKINEQLVYSTPQFPEVAP